MRIKKAHLRLLGLGLAVIAGAGLLLALLCGLVHWLGTIMGLGFWTSAAVIGGVVIYAAIVAACYVVSVFKDMPTLKTVGHILVLIFLFVGINMMGIRTVAWATNTVQWGLIAKVVVMLVALPIVAAAGGLWLRLTIVKPAKVVWAFVLISIFTGALFAYDGFRFDPYRNPWNGKVLVAICPGLTPAERVHNELVTMGIDPATASDKQYRQARKAAMAKLPDEAHLVPHTALGKKGGCRHHPEVPVYTKGRAEDDGGIVEFDQDNLEHTLLMKRANQANMHPGESWEDVDKRQKRNKQIEDAVDGVTTGVTIGGGSHSGGVHIGGSPKGLSIWWFIAGAVAIVVLIVASAYNTKVFSIVMFVTAVGILGGGAAMLFGAVDSGDPTAVLKSEVSYPYVVTLGESQESYIGKADLMTEADAGNPLYVGVCGNSSFPNAVQRVSIREGKSTWRKVYKRDLHGNVERDRAGHSQRDLPSGSVTMLVHDPKGAWLGPVPLYLRNSSGPAQTFVVGHADEIPGACSAAMGRPTTLTASVDMAAICLNGGAPGPGMSPSDCTRVWK